MINVSEELKVALRDGTVPKEYLLSIDGVTFDNSYIVSESVLITESVCSSESLKFGMMDGSIFEAELFDPDDSSPIKIVDRAKVGASVIVQLKVNGTTLDMGRYKIENVSTQVSTGIIKITAYNALADDYIDRDVKDKMLTLQPDTKYSNRLSVNAIVDGIFANVSGISNGDYSVIPITPKNFDASTTWSGRVIHPTYGPTASKGWLEFHGIELVFTDKDYIYSFIDANTTMIREQLKELFDQVSQPPFIDLADEMKYRAGLRDLVGVIIHSEYETDPLEDYMYLPEPWLPEDTRSWYSLKYISDADKLTIRIPFYAVVRWNYDTITEPEHSSTFYGRYTEAQLRQAVSNVNIKRRKINELGKKLIVKTSDNDYLFQDMTLRRMQGALYEVDGLFGKMKTRNGFEFIGVSLVRDKLYPSESLYPSNGLFPKGGGVELGYSSMYSRLWAESNQVRKFKDLIVTYKSLDENGTEIEKVMTRTIHSDGTDNYNCSDNWIFLNMIWTESSIEKYVDAMAEKLAPYEWAPFEMECAGMPYLEPGDAIEIQTRAGTIFTHVFRRELKGLQNLQDTLINGYVDCY